jgi:hypothetical protein
MSETKRKTDLHTSSFLCTINANSTDEKWRTRLKEVLAQWFDNIEQFLTATNPNRVDEIKDVYAQVEKAPKTGFIHAHLFFRVIHRTKVQINLAKSNEFFKSACDRNVYFNVRFIKDLNIGIVNYLRKQIEEK